jgi:hypothetical protein
MIGNIILEVLGESLEVCGFVALMMILIEALNLESHGGIFRKISGSRVGQVALGSVLGIIPGCVGGFAVTSLYNHGLLSFGALIAMMIASSGDEAFVMLSMFPKTALLIMAFLLVLSFVLGLLVDGFKIKVRHCDDIDISEDVDAQHCKHHRGLKMFLKENVLHHVLLKHIPRVFAWTFSVLLLIAVLQRYVDVSAWISDKTVLMIILAALIGIIPESGPHLIFVTLFAQGILPLPVLLASCISQDGHSGLPLLAENKKSFLLGKALNVAAAIIVGLISMWIF